VSIGASAKSVTMRRREADATTSVRKARASAAGVAGIALEVVEGPMDGAILCGASAQVRIGRLAGNDLELHSDRSVSGEHARLSRTGDAAVWQLEDLRSTNGTWLADGRVTAPRPLRLDCDLVTGNTVIRCSQRQEDESYLPAAADIRAEIARLAAAFAPEMSAAFGAAVALAATEKRSFISDRHLFLGLTLMNPELPLLARGGGPVGSDFLLQTLHRNDHWPAGREWIGQRLQDSLVDVEVAFGDELVCTPRLLRLLLLAEEHAERASSPLIRPADTLWAYFSGPPNRPRELLERQGIAAAVAREFTLAEPPAASRPTRQPGAAAPARAGGMPVTSGDPVIDARAQEVARGLEGVAALYHLAVPEERRLAMRQQLMQEVAQLPASGRVPFLAQLRRLFPVQEGAAVADQALVARLRREVAELQVHATAGPARAASAGVPWRLLLTAAGEQREAAVAALAAEDRAAAEFLLDTLAFACAVELFIAGAVQGLKSQGVATGTLLLPGFRTSLKRMARETAESRLPGAPALKEYLMALETWLVAAVAAYHEGPELWFREFWKKASPAAIESSSAKKLWNLEALELWNRYKERVRTMTPELAADEVLRIVRQRADEHFQLMIKRRQPS